MLRRSHPARRHRLSIIATAVIAAVPLAVIAATLAGASTASAAPADANSAATSSARDLVTPSTPSDVPYQLPTTPSSPSVAADAPYTPAVLNLIAQLEPSTPPTEAELANASLLFHGGI
jgi:glucose/arabinose dehydrogenase